MLGTTYIKFKAVIIEMYPWYPWNSLGVQRKRLSVVKPHTTSSTT